MNCHYCGTELKNKEIFCSCCGTRRIQPAPSQASAQETPVQKPSRTAEEEFPDIRPMRLSVAEPARAVEQEKRPPYVPYGAPVRKCPMIQLPVSRSLAKMIFLGILTLGIYPMVIWSRIVTEMNIAASRYDGERTMSCVGAMALAPITLGVYPFIWIHGFCHRVGMELKRRGLNYEFGASTFWLWNILGALILVGPFIFTHKLMRSMNLINSDFNVHG